MFRPELRNQYGMFIGQREIQRLELLLERVVIIPREIPVPPRGHETHTVAMMRQPMIRKDGPIIHAKWQFRPASRWTSHMDLLITVSVGIHWPCFQGIIDASNRYRWFEMPPDTLPEGYECKVETRVIPHVM
jgi:hypothetical protein